MSITLTKSLVDVSLWLAVPWLSGSETSPTTACCPGADVSSAVV